MKETRIFAAPVEVREESSKEATIAGYGAVFDTPYDVMGMFTEQVARSAFDKTLKERDDLAVVWSHDADRVLGTQASGTARFGTDARGLRYEADLDLLDPDGLQAFRKIATGKVRQSSFSFEVIRDEWEDREDGLPLRTLRELRLWEISPVLWGANPATEVDLKRAARSLANATDTDAEALEAALASGRVADVLHSAEETTQTPADGPPAEAPAATSSPEPTRSDITL